MRRGLRIAALAALMACCGCSLLHPPERFGARAVSYTELSGWAQDDHAQALAAFIAACPSLMQKPENISSGSGLHVPASVWQSLCSEAAGIPRGDEAQARAFFERRFRPYRINNRGSEEGLFTGYYEPLLFGSWHKHGDFIYPVYLPPPELKGRQPYLPRQTIDNGALARRHLELIWVDDPVMLFFMQVQGSGMVHMSDGSHILIGFAGKNGQTYQSLGRIMGDEGLIPKDQINFFTIRQWLYKHHDRAVAMMQRNPSYIFFRRLNTPGPVGASGAVLTPLRSLAIDNRYIPYGLPLFLETELPAMPQQSPVAFHHLMMAQDTGSAIKGPVRGDIFFGEGDEAEYYAGYMKGHGRYSLLVPREVASQLQ